MSLLASAPSGSKRPPPSPVPPAQTRTAAAPPAHKRASLLPADEPERAEQVEALARRFVRGDCGVALAETLEEERHGTDVLARICHELDGPLLMLV